MSNTFGIIRSTGQVTGHTEKITITDEGTLTRTDEGLDFSAWDALDPVSEVIYTDDVKKAKFTGWQSNSSANVPSVIEGV